MTDSKSLYRDVKQYPHRAKEFGYSYPDNPYLTESIAYAKLYASIFCKPRYVSHYNPTGLVAELVEGKFTESQKQTLGTLLGQQNKLRLQLANELIPFYNRCLPFIEDAFEQDKESLLSFGATSLSNDDVIGLEERLYWEDVHLTAKDGYGDFGMEFAWNLDPEHTITARFKNWQILQLGFTSEIDW